MGNRLAVAVWKAEQGEYRIIKDILDFRGTGDFDTHYLAAEFTVD